MQYRQNPKNGEMLSQLGLGCMRLPKRANRIDQEKTNEMVRYAVENGVNYFDTAYFYSGSEEALGNALELIKAREKVNIATKLPVFFCKSTEDFDRFFYKQLERLKTDYIDYYFMHMLSDTQTWERLKRLGILEWIEAKRNDGQIRNIGFSYHGGRVEFKSLLDSYDWDFCMLQYNYLDKYNQAGLSGVNYASKKGLPGFVMEPLRGGLLAGGLSAKARMVFDIVDKKRSYAEWGLRWVFNHPQVTTVLSGMSDMAQLAENIRLAETATANALTKTELKVYDLAVRALNETTKIPCTSCGYCLPCPQGVDIPLCFASYNESYNGQYFKKLVRYYQYTGHIAAKQSDASKCTQCRACEKHCPQQIPISRRLEEVRSRMLTPVVKPAMKLVRKTMQLNK